jgi:hypothetical protein
MNKILENTAQEINLPKGVCYLCFPKEKFKVNLKKSPKEKMSAMAKILQSKIK